MWCVRNTQTCQRNTIQIDNRSLKMVLPCRVAFGFHRQLHLAPHEIKKKRLEKKTAVVLPDEWSVTKCNKRRASKLCLCHGVAGLILSLPDSPFWDQYALQPWHGATNAVGKVRFHIVLLKHGRMELGLIYTSSWNKEPSSCWNCDGKPETIWNPWRNGREKLDLEQCSINVWPWTSIQYASYLHDLATMSMSKLFWLCSSKKTCTPLFKPCCLGQKLQCTDVPSILACVKNCLQKGHERHMGVRVPMCMWEGPGDGVRGHVAGFYFPETTKIRKV